MHNKLLGHAIIGKYRYRYLHNSIIHMEAKALAKKKKKEQNA